MGEDALLSLLEAHAGVRVYVPRNPRGSNLTELIGEAAAAALCAQHGGEHILVPSVKVWRVQMYNQRGMATTDIARRVGLSQRTVFRILGRVAGPRGDRRQAQLF